MRRRHPEQYLLGVSSSNLAVRLIECGYTTTMIAPTALNITLVTETYAPEVNGVAMTLSRLTAGLVARGHRIQVVRPRVPDDYQDGCPPLAPVQMFLRPGIPMPNYPQMRLGVPSRPHLRAAWRAQRPDVVHVATEGPMGASAMLAARDLGIPCTSSYHTNFEDYTRAYGAQVLEGAVGRWLRWVHNLARCTMVPTKVQALDLQRRGYRGVCVLSRGVDPELFNPSKRSAARRAEWGATDDTLVLVTVGRLAQEKNLDLAKRALAEIRKDRPDTILVLVGAGPERDRLAGDGVVLAGNRCACDLAEHYASADLFLFPSTTETYGNVLPEAMACGLPCVGYFYAAAEELVSQDVDGVTVPVDDEDGFVAAAVALAGDPERRARLGAEATKVVERRGWQRVINAFEGHLLAAVAGESPVLTPV